MKLPIIYKQNKKNNSDKYILNYCFCSLVL